MGTTEGKIKLLRELRRGKVGIPVVLIIAASRDEIARSQMLDDGAVECLVKPFRRDTGTAPIAAIYGDRYAVPLSPHVRSTKALNTASDATTVDSDFRRRRDLT